MLERLNVFPMEMWLARVPYLVSEELVEGVNDDWLLLRVLLIAAPYSSNLFVRGNRERRQVDQASAWSL